MIQSEAFGRTFWLDANDEFKSAPSLVSGGADYEMRDYVSEWTDWDGVNVDLLLSIYRQLLTTKIDKFYADRMQSIIVLLQLGKIQPEIQLRNCHTISPTEVIFVYYKSMKFTDDFQINLTSQQHSLLCDMCSFAATADFEVHHDSETFNQVWDLVLNASHNIVTEDS